MMFSSCVIPAPKKLYNHRWFDLDLMREYESMPEKADAGTALPSAITEDKT
jgi:hypothetical protein